MLVLDANVVLGAAAMKDGFSLFGEEELVASPLLWPEARSALHVSLWRGLISREVSDRSRSILESGRVWERGHRRLGREAWRIADELGWAKTYAAEYLALACLVDGRLVTFDRRLQRAAERLGLATGIPLP
ncbi:MAG: type II toxin-antitoxin system VapC family toxin [Actinomycetota bacterium]